MPSLENRVAHQRATLTARNAVIRKCGRRIHTRLRHPGVLIPAFLSGMLTARVAPVLLRVLPRLTARLRHFSEEFSRLDATIRLVGGLAPSQRSQSAPRPPE